MNLSEQWLPESVRCFRAYSRRDFGADLLAGVTVGLVALPLAMAFGIASGVTPQAGLYTAIVAGGLFSALGGSRIQSWGPAGAVVAVGGGPVREICKSRLVLSGFVVRGLPVMGGVTRPRPG